ncbi:PLD nuclease N-terminal domain-containing protein [Hymenobacter cheonanensis]|uniref:PLD nuclease N-terminal domain-containing protein n=1 Tax=Hymenobacter sp. CA2-7 TaxID=3063993 RepID=UPI00271420C8|nr:PLD nuclease N-terminal domain-containing protein [Hymenobacter sp. CA2-7]MDO7884858.1 PLD nuclease N-terminal domain-containing protein [Hymenobacter sp. CA2-7]
MTRFLSTIAARLSPAMLLGIISSLLLTSCGPTRTVDGRLTTAGVIHLILALYCIVNLLGQNWSLGKKLIWGLIIFFFPFGGSILYLLFSGRN